MDDALLGFDGAGNAIQRLNWSCLTHNGVNCLLDQRLGLADLEAASYREWFTAVFRHYCTLVHCDVDPPP